MGIKKTATNQPRAAPGGLRKGTTMSITIRIAHSAITYPMEKISMIFWFK